MNYIKASVLFIIYLEISVLQLYGQNHYPDRQDIFEQLTVEEGDEIGIGANEAEELSELVLNPVNLNNATKGQLESIPFLSDIQIENILAYIYIHGQMQSIYELQMIEDMDRMTIQYILPFVYVSPVYEKEYLPTVRNVVRYGKHEITTRLDIPFYERKGYKGQAGPDNTYLGDAVYNSLRYGFRYRDNIYAGITAEKDAGEPLFALHNKKGYDYYSFYFYIRNIRNLKALAIGNYRLSFGQGLVVSNDFTLGKTTSATTLFTRNNTIKKHSSTDEYNYFRGVASSFQWNKFILSGFYSNRSHDGIADKQTITSINKTGLHRSRREAERKNVFTMQITGGNIAYSSNNLKLGLTGIYYFFDRPYQPQVREYSKYNISGNYFHNMGIDYKYRHNRFTFAGEFAICKSNGIAALNTINYSPVPGYALILVHRYYDYNYWALYARSFSEGGYVQNENGWYFSAEANPIKYWSFFLSADFFSFPWRKYDVDAPSQGMDFSVQATYSPHKRFTMFWRYRYKQKDKNYTDENKVKTVRPLFHHRFRYQLKYSLNTNINMRTTLDYNQIYPENVNADHGYQITETVSYTFNKLPLKVELQGSYFNTDDYSSRVYSSEKGLLYTFYTPSYYGEGIRLAAHIRYDLYKNRMIIAKYGHTQYFDRSEIGSGRDLIPGNIKSDLQLQLRFKF